MNKLLLLNGVIYVVLALVAKTNTMPVIMAGAVIVAVVFTSLYVILDNKDFKKC